MRQNFLAFIFFLFWLHSFSFAQSIQTSIQKFDSLGEYHWQNASYNQAIFYYKKALPLAQKLKDAKWEARILNYLGIIYENKGDFEISISYHFKALKLRELLKDKLEIAKSYINLGIAYASSGQDNKGLEYYFKTLAIYEQSKVKEKRLECHTLYHISTSYRRLKRYQEANQYALNALQKAQNIGEEVIIIDAQNGLGLIATEQKEYSKGREYYQKVYDLAEKAQDWLILTNNLQHFAENYEQDLQPEKAIEFAKKSLVLAQKHGLKVEEKNAYFILASLYHKQNKYKEAYDYQQRWNTLKDTLFNLQKSQQIAELTIQYETEKKEKQIQSLQKDRQYREYTIYALVLVMLLLGFIAVYRYQLQKKIHHEKQKVSEAKLALKTLESKMEQEKYEEKIAFQERELASNTMHLFQKNEMLNNLQEKLESLKPDVKTQVKPLLQEVRNTINLDKDWENFQRHFVEVHPNFFDKLLEVLPSLSQTELKILAYIRMKLSNKEVALLMNVASKSVEMARYRLKKKFGLSQEDSLDRWLEKF